MKTINKIMMTLVASTALVGAVYLQTQWNELEKQGEQARKEGFGRYIKADESGNNYATETIYLNDTVLKLYDRDEDNKIDGVLYGKGLFPAFYMKGKLGLDNFFYREQKLYLKKKNLSSNVLFEISQNTIDLATKIYKGGDVSKEKKEEWRKDVRNLVQRVNADYELMYKSK
jgi:hypothetical protein